MPGLRTIAPLEITDAVLIEQPATEDDSPAWVADTPYSASDRVHYQHVVYQAGASVNDDIPPPENPTVWIKIGSTNSWALFNGRSSQASVFNATASYRFRFGRAIDAVAVIGAKDVQVVRVRVIDPTYGTVYDKSVTVGLAPDMPDWWAWFFGEWTETGALGIFDGLPSFPLADVLVDFTGTSSMRVGNLILGNAKEWGLGVEIGASVGIEDYSRKETDEYGNRILVERTYVGWANMSVPITRREITLLKNYLAASRAKPILFLASQDIEALNIFGIAMDWSIAIEYFDYSKLEIQVEEI